MKRDSRDKKPSQKGQESFKRRMYVIDKEIRQKEAWERAESKRKNPDKNRFGARKYVLDTLARDGQNAAVLALKIYNKKRGTNFTWKDVEKWIEEEKQKAGDEIDDIN